MNLFMPIVFTIMISNQVGYVYTRSLYERAVRGKQMPILIDKVPTPCKYIIAEDFMQKKVITVQSVETVANISRALHSGHHAFPVLNKSGNAAGLIPRNFLITILKRKGFYVDPSAIPADGLTPDSADRQREGGLDAAPRLSAVDEAEERAE